MIRRPFGGRGSHAGKGRSGNERRPNLRVEHDAEPVGEPAHPPLEVGDEPLVAHHKHLFAVCSRPRVGGVVDNPGQ